MPFCYYYPVDKFSSKPKLNLLRTVKGETYDVFYGKWEDIKTQLENKSNIRPGKSAKNFEKLKERLISIGTKKLKIYYAAEDTIKSESLQPIGNIEIYDNGRTKLHFAAKKGNIEEIQQILEEMPDLLNVQDSKGYTPLHYAISFGHENAIICLRDKGANFEIGAKISDTAKRNVKPMEVLDTSEEGYPRLLNNQSLRAELKQKISELFPIARHCGITITFDKDAEGYYRQIKNIDITRDGLRIDDNVRYEWYPKDSRGSDDECRHRVAFDWIADQFKQNLIGRDYHEVAKELCSAYKNETSQTSVPVNTTKSFADLLSHWFMALAQSLNLKKEKASHNLFYGDKVANQCKGWLISELKKKGRDAQNFLFPITNEYQGWFSKDPGCDLAPFVIREGNQWCIRAQNRTDVLTLWQLAVIDDENFARGNDDFSSPTSQHIADLISRFGHLHSQRLDHIDYSTLPTMPPSSPLITMETSTITSTDDEIKEGKQEEDTEDNKAKPSASSYSQTKPSQPWEQMATTKIPMSTDEGKKNKPKDKREDHNGNIMSYFRLKKPHNNTISSPQALPTQITTAITPAVMNTNDSKKNKNENNESDYGEISSTNKKPRHI